MRKNKNFFIVNSNPCHSRNFLFTNGLVTGCTFLESRPGTKPTPMDLSNTQRKRARSPTPSTTNAPPEKIQKVVSTAETQSPQNIQAVNPNLIQVILKFPNEKTFQVGVTPENTIWELKTQIMLHLSKSEHLACIDPGQQVLGLAGTASFNPSNSSSGSASLPLHSLVQPSARSTFDRHCWHSGSTSHHPKTMPTQFFSPLFLLTSQKKIHGSPDSILLASVLICVFF